MRNIRFLAVISTLIIIIILAACSASAPPGEISASPLSNMDVSLSTPTSDSSGQIYLYGEQHGIEKILNKEFEQWREYYHDENMRYLFVELPYYTAEFLNIWMKEDNDGILNTLYKEWEGTASHNPLIKEFYKKIKNECPKTIFRGTDVGHQYDTTGKRFLEYLEAKNLKESDQYLMTQDAIAQGKHYYNNEDGTYRENKMAENFIREFDKLIDENVMGIYGGAHTGLDAMDYNTQTIPCMANQLKQRYGDAVHASDLSWMAKEIEPVRIDKIKLNEKEYAAVYFGKQDLSWMEGYAYRAFWRLDNAYDDFKDKTITGDILPYDNYPMLIETGQVFVIDYTRKDGSVVRMYYRSDGGKWEGLLSTVEFKPD